MQINLFAAQIYKNAAEVLRASAARCLRRLFAAAAAVSAVGVDLAVVDLAVGLLHEVFELVLKARVSGRADDLSVARRGIAVIIVRTRRVGALLSLSLRIARTGIRAGRAAVRTRSRGAVRRRMRRGRLRLLDGKVDFSHLVDAEDLYLHHVADFQEVINIVYKGIGNLGNVHETASAAGKRDERSEFGDACYSAFENRSDFKIHGYPFLFRPEGGIKYVCFETFPPALPLRKHGIYFNRKF